VREQSRHPAAWRDSRDPVRTSAGCGAHGRAVSADITADASEKGRLRLLQLSALTSTCDRFAIAPLLVVIGLDLGEPLAAVAAVASAYYLAYGLMQVVWGMVSDRIGRVRVMRLSLLGAAVAGIGSALAPNLLVLGVSRVLAGACFAAIIPSTLVYIGDMWPPAVRQRPLSDLLAASSLGIAVATAGAGLLADLVGWRAVPAVTGLAGAALWVALARLPEPDREAGAGAHPLRSVGRVLGQRWSLVVFVEGAVVLGALTYLPAAVQGLGWSAGVAGLVSAAYGVAALAFSRLVRALVGRLSRAAIAGTGGALMVLGWALPAVWLGVPTVLAAGVLIGGAWAFLHTTLQSWATEVVPAERATAVALFATLLFFGSSVGTAAAGGAVESGAFGPVFAVAAVAAVPLAAASALALRRYARTSR
jgi:predicted MFS family arabinose efflux permease